MPAGERWRGVPHRAAVVRVLRMDMFRKICMRTDVGLGEAYMGERPAPVSTMRADAVIGMTSNAPPTAVALAV